jgi:hypothetical protein
MKADWFLVADEDDWGRRARLRRALLSLTPLVGCDWGFFQFSGFQSAPEFLANRKKLDRCGGLKSVWRSGFTGFGDAARKWFFPRPGVGARKKWKFRGGDGRPTRNCLGIFRRPSDPEPSTFRERRKRSATNGRGFLGWDGCIIPDRRLESDGRFWPGGGARWYCGEGSYR